MIGQFSENRRSLLLRVRFVAKHAAEQPVARHVNRPLDRLFAFPDQSWRVLGDDWLPDRDGGGVRLDLGMRPPEFFDDAECRDVTELRVDRAQTGMLAHQYLIG